LESLQFNHTPVLLQESIDWLNPQDGGIYLDATLGGGGHTQQILESANCKVVAIDKDLDAIENAKKKFVDYGDRLIVVHSDFANVNQILSSIGINCVDGALMDLGVSSYQIDTPSRGFSYIKDGSLDMRMDRTKELDAKYIVNTYPTDQIAKILKDYGEERFAQKIANNIVKYRQQSPITTTLQLAEIVRATIPFVKSGHPAKKTFMALRIAVNNELDILAQTIKSIVKKIKIGGKLCIITFHSLEDRIVKRLFNDLSNGCVCDKKLPMCVCGFVASLQVHKKVKPSTKELQDNKRAASATLRIATKI